MIRRRRIRVNSYGASKSARELANYLGVKRILINGSKFRGKNTDTIINWGNGKGNVGDARQINKLQNVQLASNKHKTLIQLRLNAVSTPYCVTHRSALVPGRLYMARTTLTGHSGQGIVTGYPMDLPQAPLYVEYIAKVAEYRAIVVGNEVVDFKKKKKRNSQEGEERIQHDEYVWNLDGGYIFARNGFDVPLGAGQLGIDAVNALGLDFGAVDIIEDTEGKLYVLEVNTAFGLEGQTIELVGDAIRRLL